jgi:hypothetical protein
MNDTMLRLWLTVNGYIKRSMEPLGPEAGLSQTVENLLWAMLSIAVVVALIPTARTRVVDAANNIFDQVVNASGG